MKKIDFRYLLFMGVEAANRGLDLEGANKDDNWCDISWFDKISENVIITRHNVEGHDLRKSD